MFPRVNFVLEVLAECTSSQEILLAKRGGPDFHGLAVLALRQTAGYGRRGRVWESGDGNFALSFGLEIAKGDGAEEAIPLLPFAAGLAAYHAAARFLPATADLRLKWPNDLYLNGKKLAGLIAQARQIPGGLAEVVVGVGLNLARPPVGIDQEATALSSAGSAPAPEEFARIFLAELRDALAEKDPARLCGHWERVARLSESELFILGEERSVRPRSLLPTGELLVEEQNGNERKLASEEVSIRFATVG